MITELSTTAASNSPAGTEAPSVLDDIQRAHGAFIAQLYAGTVEAATVIVASAATTNIGGAASENVDISGTTTITSFGTAAEGINRKGRFTGILLLTHNATSLILPGNANITTAANDRYEARSLGAGNWIVTKYERANGGAINNIFKVGIEATAAWGATWRVVDIGTLGAFYINPTGTVGIAQNAYNDGTNWRARVTGPAAVTQIEPSGEEVYYSAPSVAAGAILAFNSMRRTSVAGVMTLAGNAVRDNGNTFHGRVNADGTAARLPSGWSSVKNSTGLYTITHSLGTANYTCSPVAENAADIFANLNSKGTTTFAVVTRNSAGTATDSAFHFTLMLD